MHALAHMHADRSKSNNMYDDEEQQRTTNLVIAPLPVAVPLNSPEVAAAAEARCDLILGLADRLFGWNVFNLLEALGVCPPPELASDTDPTTLGCPLRLSSSPSVPSSERVVRRGSLESQMAILCERLGVYLSTRQSQRRPDKHHLTSDTLCQRKHHSLSNICLYVHCTLDTYSSRAADRLRQTLVVQCSRCGRRHKQGLPGTRLGGSQGLEKVAKAAHCWW